MRTEKSCTSKTQIPEKVKEKVDRFGYVKILKMSAMSRRA